jgi:hypothetical protein
MAGVVREWPDTRPGAPAPYCVQVAMVGSFGLTAAFEAASCRVVPSRIWKEASASDLIFVEGLRKNRSISITVTRY